MQLVYLDEAGVSNEAHEPFLVVAGVIVNPDRQWRDLEAHFAKLSKKYFKQHDGEPIVFHAKDIWHGSGPYPRDKWPLRKRVKLMHELADVPATFKLPIVMGYVNRMAARQWLKEHVPDAPEKNIRSMIHAHAFLNAIRRVENWMTENTNEVAMLIAEDAPDIKSYIHALHKLYTDRSLMDNLPDGAFLSQRIVDTVHFAKKNQSLLLQIADHCAFIMKRQLMKRPDAAKLFAKISPQIAWKPSPKQGIALKLRRSEFEIVTTSGSIIVGDSQELFAAFDSVVDGARSSLGKDILLPHLKTLREAQALVFAAREGRQYLRARPTLEQRMARLSHRRSDQK